MFFGLSVRLWPLWSLAMRLAVRLAAEIGLSVCQCALCGVPGRSMPFVGVVMEGCMLHAGFSGGGRDTIVAA